MVEPARTAPGDESKYGHLIERAVAFVSDHGGIVPEEMLIGHVFGTSGPPALWHDLISTILGGDQRLEHRPNGSWALAGVADASDATTFELAIIDVETTGLRPRNHRITEVAIVLVDADDRQSSWSTLVNPERSIPEQISKLTGIKNQDVAHAPTFHSIAPTVLDLIGNRLVVGHNVEFDVGFLNAELRRAGQSALVNPTIDTLALADAVLPGLRRLSLAAVAKKLEIPRKSAHRAAPDAELTGDVFERLRAIAHDAGHGSLESLQELGTPRRRRRRRSSKDSGRGRSILDRSLLADIPHAPGVYIMRNADDRVIYVGKAKDLYKRVSSYFSEPLGYTRKMDGLLASIDTIEVEVVGSEFEALVLESELIRRYRPRFNRQQRNVEQYVYIKVDVTNRWPTVTTSRDRADDGARYFGPFRSQRHARDAVRLINDALPLRTCRRSFKDGRSLGSACVELQLKRCPGPCLGIADPDTYLGHVRTVLSFFEGDRDPLLQVVHQNLESAAARLDYEKAARLRDQIARLERVAQEQETINVARRVESAILVLPGVRRSERRLWYLLRGRRWAALDVGPEEMTSSLSQRLAVIRQRAVAYRGTMESDHHAVEEMALLSRWIRRSPDHPALVQWPDDLTAESVARQVLDVDLGIPFGESDSDVKHDEKGDSI